MAVANSATVKARTGLSAHRLRTQPDNPRWLRTSTAKDTGQVVTAQSYADGRYMEIQLYDYESPFPERCWIITVIDRQTGASVTLRGGGQNETTCRALQQIGALDA